MRLILRQLSAFRKNMPERWDRILKILENPASVDKPETVGPEKLPDIWTVDTEYLLKELARIRELALHVPFNTTRPIDLHAPINSVINAVWNLEQLINFCLQTQRAMQRSFAEKASRESAIAKKTNPNPKVAQIKAS